MSSAVIRWTKRKTVVVAILTPLAAFLVFFAVIVIDGEGYDRHKNVRELRLMHSAWIRDGSPEPPDIRRYAQNSRYETSFVYSASHVIDGQTYVGLFAHRSYPRFGTFVITRDGQIIVVDDEGRARLAWIHKKKAAAW